MSVVICYSCNDFSIIATDTLVTYDNGYQEDSYEKIHQLYEHGMVFFAGTGLSEIIDSAFTFLKQATTKDYDDIKQLFQNLYESSLKTKQNIQENEFANLAISYMSIKGPQIIFIPPDGDWNYIKHNKFFILPPPDVHADSFSSVIGNSLNYTYDGNFNQFLCKLGEIFYHFSSHSKFVSATIRCGLHYFFNDTQDNVRRREWTYQNVTQMIEQSKTGQYTCIQYELNTHEHFKD